MQENEYPDRELMGLGFVRKLGKRNILPARTMTEKERTEWKKGRSNGM